jgi:hypothetical protein
MITGQIQTATGGVIANGTLTFRKPQRATQPHTCFQSSRDVAQCGLCEPTGGPQWKHAALQRLQSDLHSRIEHKENMFSRERSVDALKVPARVALFIGLLALCGCLLGAVNAGLTPLVERLHCDRSMATNATTARSIGAADKATASLASSLSPNDALIR